MNSNSLLFSFLRELSFDLFDKKSTIFLFSSKNLYIFNFSFMGNLLLKAEFLLQFSTIFAVLITHPILLNKLNPFFTFSESVTFFQLS